MLKSADAKLYIATQNLPVRKNKRPHSLVVGFIGNGAAVDVTNIKGNWGKVKYQDKYGYIQTGHLKAAPPVTSKPENEPESETPSSGTTLVWIAGLAGFALVIRILFFAKKNYSGKTIKSKKNAAIGNTLSFVYWYQCKHCSAVVKKSDHPSHDGCISAKLHHWTQLAEVGLDKYMCRHCLTTIQTTTFPATSGCPGAEFHVWNKL